MQKTRVEKEKQGELLSGCCQVIEALCIRRVRMGRGFGEVDLMLLPRRGPHRLVLVEAKLGKSPDARAKVIGQLLWYYAGALALGTQGLNLLRQFASSTSSPQLSADQKTQYTYASWSDGGAQSHTITVPTSNTTYTATFTTQFRLDTVANPAGIGSVSPNPIGPWHNTNQVVQVTNNPNANYALDLWGGDCAGQGNPCSVTMTSPKSVTGTFVCASWASDRSLSNQTLTGTQVFKAKRLITAANITQV